MRPIRSAASATGSAAICVVFGSYVTIGRPGAGTIRLDARLQDSRAGGTLAQVSETGTEAEVLTLVSRIGRRLRERLNVEALPPAATAAVRASQPANVDAARLYAEGLERLHQFDALAARDRLERAVAADPRFPLAHAALAMAWSTLGYDNRAKAAAGTAFELSSALSREDRLSVEGAYREMARRSGSRRSRMLPDAVPLLSRQRRVPACGSPTRRWRRAPRRRRWRRSTRCGPPRPADR